MKYRRRQVLRGIVAMSATAIASSVARAQSASGVVGIAETIAVRIVPPGSPGSGVLVGREGLTYFVLTAKHVVAGTSGGEEAYVVTPDGQRHRLDTSAGAILEHPNFDLAVVQFQSDRDYSLAQVGDSNSLQLLEDELVVAGFRLVEGAQSESLTFGRGFFVSRSDGGEGYRLSYELNTSRGMSGGPVLNLSGQLVGIHGRAEGEVINGVPVRDGFGLGIPIALFQEWQPIALSQAPEPRVTPAPTPPAATGNGQLRTFSFEVVTLGDRGRELSRETKQAGFFTEDLGNGIELEMVRIPGGRFTMGSPDTEEGRFADEETQRQVTVEEFYMGKYAVTQEEWYAVVTLLPKVNRGLPVSPSRAVGARRPVEQIDWFDAKEFCDRLSRATGKEYRLPLEAEWEYACRAGTTTPFHFGNTITTNLANYRGTDVEFEGEIVPGNYGRGPRGDYREETLDVGSFLPNSFGLYDMHGNVSEWCEDGPVEVSEEVRMLRGGSFSDVPWGCRSANRGRDRPSSKFNNVGYRIICTSV